MQDDVIISELKDVVIDYRARAWCRLPYPNHPNGCPNFGKSEECPPKAPLFEAIIKPPFTLVAVRFNLEEHVRKMKEKHPNWSEKKTKCLLYWQRKVNKRLKKFVKV
jgi:predicted metal-binding protein